MLRLRSRGTDRPATDGSDRFHHSRGRVVCDDEGRPTRMIGACQDVTELRRAEKEREQILGREHRARLESDASRRLISSILERISDAFVSLDSEWRYTHVNEKAGKLLGRRPEDLIGKHIWTVFPEGIGQKFHDAYHQAMREQKPVHLEDFYPPWNRWFENRIYPSKDGLSIFFTDVTERRLAEDALRASQDRFREIAETIVEAFWVVSGDLKTLRYLSPAFETIFGIPPAPLDRARDAWIAAMHPDDRQGVLDTFAQGPDEGALEGTYRFYRPDGAIRWCRWRGLPGPRRVGRGAPHHRVLRGHHGSQADRGGAPRSAVAAGRVAPRLPGPGRPARGAGPHAGLVRAAGGEERRDAGGLPAAPAGGAERRDGAAHRRVGNRKGTGGVRDPLPERATERPFVP